MANPRQRKKVRSSSYKPVKQSKRANKLLRKQPPIKGPSVLREAWNKHKTVRQNYAALGLAHSLTPSGDDQTQPFVAQGHQISGPNPESMSGSGEEDARPRHRTSEAPSDDLGKDGRLPRGFGRIIRNDSGAVVDVVLAEEMSVGEEAAKDRGLEHFEIESSSGQPERIPVPSGSGWLLKKNDKEVALSEGSKEVIQALEAASMAGSKKVRTASAAEVKYLTRLMKIHGTDYEAMAKDRKVNVNQYSAGQLRRAIEKAGMTKSGCVALLGSGVDRG